MPAQINDDKENIDKENENNKNHQDQNQNQDQGSSEQMDENKENKNKEEVFEYPDDTDFFPEQIYDIISTIRDPEKPYTLE